MLSKKIFLPILVYLLIMFIQDVEAGAQEHIKTSWGMRKSEVKELMEIDPVLVDRDIVVYNDIPLGNLMSTAGFIFNRRDRLVKKTYIFHVNHVDPIGYVLDKINLRGQLDMFYGKSDTNVHWKNIKYVNDADRLGEAVVNGAVEIVSVWHNMDTTIVLSLRGEEGEAKLVMDMLWK